MKHHVMILILLATASTFVTGMAKAQSNAQGLTPQPNQTDSALTAEIRRAFQSTSTNLLKAAREMPEDSYNFKPSDDVRSFGELVTHIARVQQALCENINGHAAKNAVQPASKEAMVKALDDSIGECTISFAELSAQNENKMVKAPAGEVTHLAALVFIITHATEEYGQMSMYLRIKHLTPPTTDDVKGGAAGKS
jgi:uncharacterized damage-inducible protein DinB